MEGVFKTLELNEQKANIFSGFVISRLTVNSENLPLHQPMERGPSLRGLWQNQSQQDFGSREMKLNV